jgi:hypothetical protein
MKHPVATTRKIALIRAIIPIDLIAVITSFDTHSNLSIAASG